MIPYLLQGIALGFAAAVQPGPFLAYLTSIVFSLGWRRTLPVVLAPLLSDGPIIVLVVLLLNQVPGWFRHALSIAGGIFILYLAWAAFQRWRAQPDALPAIKKQQDPPRHVLWQAVLVNLLGPGPYLFWSLVGGPILLRGWSQTPSYAVGFLFGFYTAMLISLTVIVLVFGSAWLLGERASRALLGFSVIALVCFGIYQLYIGLRGV